VRSIRCRNTKTWSIVLIPLPNPAWPSASIPSAYTSSLMLRAEPNSTLPMAIPRISCIPLLISCCQCSSRPTRTRVFTALKRTGFSALIQDRQKSHIIHTVPPSTSRYKNIGIFQQFNTQTIKAASPLHIILIQFHTIDKCERAFTREPHKPPTQSTTQTEIPTLKLPQMQPSPRSQAYKDLMHEPWKLPQVTPSTTFK
jgi:hypothetical protein